MINKRLNDWVAGDLVKITREHYLSKGDPDGVWPKVFFKTESGSCIESNSTIPAGTVLMALDSKPQDGDQALIRVLYEGEVWVANSNNVARESCIGAKQEKCSL